MQEYMVGYRKSRFNFLALVPVSKADKVEQATAQALQLPSISNDPRERGVGVRSCVRETRKVRRLDTMHWNIISYPIPKSIISQTSLNNLAKSTSWS